MPTDALVYPDLIITKANSVDEISPGDVIEFEITVQNIGGFQADGVKVVDLIDTEVYEFVSASNGGVHNAGDGTVTWNLGIVAPGDPVIRLTLQLEALFAFPDDELAENTVTVSSDLTRGQEITLENNTAMVIDAFLAAPDPAEIAGVFGDDEEDEEIELRPVLFYAPLFSGQAPAGANVQVQLIGADGSTLGQATTYSSASGAWLVSMPDIVADSQPVSAVVTTFAGGFTPVDPLTANNVFYSPGGDSPVTFQREFAFFEDRDDEARAQLMAQIAASENPLASSPRDYVNFNEVSGAGLSTQ